MRRTFLLPLAALLVGGFHEWAPAHASLVPHTSSCANSFPADGHPGPWRTTNNGGTLHGNTLHINCPNPSTHWHIFYRVQGQTGSVWVNVLTDERQGNGSPPDFSAGLSPYQCDTVNVYRTHVDNVVTGGTINKPSGGGGVHLAC